LSTTTGRAANVEIRRQGQVATIIMCRPHSNAMCPELMLDLVEALGRLEADPEVRAIVLASEFEGVFFSVGLDLGIVSAFDRTQPDAERNIVEIFTGMGRCFSAVARCPKPVIAAIYGHALGGGCELALCCDYRLMAEDGRSRIGLTEVNLGLMPADGATQRLPRLVGVARALPLLYEGRRLTALEAEGIGLAIAVTPQDYHAALGELAARLAKGPTRVLGLIKDAVQRGFDMPLDAALQLEREHFARACLGDDALIGVSSFLSGKEPEFMGT
jgi:enoyl-CoA hydratase/carnithine racemase